MTDSPQGKGYVVMPRFDTFEPKVVAADVAEFPSFPARNIFKKYSQTHIIHFVRAQIQKNDREMTELR